MKGKKLEKPCKAKKDPAWLLVEFVEDKIQYICSETNYKNKKAKWRDGKYYPAIIIQTGAKSDLLQLQHSSNLASYPWTEEPDGTSTTDAKQQTDLPCTEKPGSSTTDEKQQTDLPCTEKPGSSTTDEKQQTDLPCTEKPGSSTTDEKQQTDLPSTEVPCTSATTPEADLPAKASKLYKKRQMCFICDKYYLKLARHMENCHANEEEVKAVLTLPKNSKARRMGFGHLCRKGNFKHNVKELETGGEQLILGRQPTPSEEKLRSAESYAPCPNCLNFLLKKNLWIHLKRCKRDKSLKSPSEQRVNAICESMNLLKDVKGNSANYSHFNSVVLKNMKTDPVTQTVKNDSLILQFGLTMFDQYDVNQLKWIRQSMRQLGRLLIKLHQLDNSNDSLSTYIRPSKFDQLLTAVRHLAEEERDTGRPDYKTPSLALKLGIALKKCGKIKRDTYVMEEDLAGAELMSNFIELFEVQWRSRVSGPALRSLRITKSKSLEVLPLTSDLLKMSKYIAELTPKLREDLGDSPTSHKWAQLAQLTLCRSILFNRRRSGEASRMLITDYESTSNRKGSSEEQEATLSKFEKRMLNYMTLIKVIGKRFRPVSVLLTPDMIKSINVLLATRSAVGISEKNPYIFARVHYSSESYLCGSEAVRTVATLAKTEHPERVTSTKLRKHVATVIQIANLTENEADGLAKYLGHDIRVHRNFYRLQEDAFISAKVAKILVAMDKGHTNRIQNKTLDEIELSDLSDVSEEVEDEEEEQPGRLSNIDEEETAFEEPLPSKEPISLRNKKITFARQSDTDDGDFSVSEDDYIPHSDDDESDTEDEPSKKRKKCNTKKQEDLTRNQLLVTKMKLKGKLKQGKTRKPSVKITWTPRSSKFLEHKFNTYIYGRNSGLPGKGQLEEAQNCQNAPSPLRRRPWRQVKDFVRNRQKAYQRSVRKIKFNEDF